MFDFNLRYITWCGSWGRYSNNSSKMLYRQNLFIPKDNNATASLEYFENSTSPFLTTALLIESYRKFGISFVLYTNIYYLYAKYQNKTIFWYSNSENGQFNNYYTYDYCAIGN